MEGCRKVVLRTGEGLQVTQAGARVFAVTVDGAFVAAAILEILSTQATRD